MESRRSALGRMVLTLSALLLLLCRSAVARCECGYSIADPDNDAGTLVFTDMFETDFTKLDNITLSRHWERMEFNVSAEDGRGKYGKRFMRDNIDTQLSRFQEAGSDDAGLGLRVGGELMDEAVPVAELDSYRSDLRWGSYRAGMKTTGVDGTCAAFFWYFNDTQEIDMEFLSREADPENDIYPLNLVLQTPESKQAGYDAIGTGSYRRVNLTFDPSAAFHEYRFDYLGDRVLFYADSKLLAEMRGNGVPSVGGHLILQHWSNGNGNWSGGPPERDALLTVNYVKAYFNSSDPEILSEKVEACSSGRSNATDVEDAVCAIPKVTADDAGTGGRFFGPIEDGEGGEGRVSDEEDGASSVVLGVPIALVTVVVSVAVCLMGAV